MKKLPLFLLLAVVAIANVYAAKPAKSDEASLEIAKATLKAHGGAEKFALAKTIVIRGSAEITAPNMPQTLPASFAMIYSGEKYRLEIQAGLFNFSQTCDGVNTISSMPGMSLPPITRVGLVMLPRIGEEGFTVSPLPEKLKKKKGFRLTSPEGYYTDFIVDEKTSQVKEYQAAYEINGRDVLTSVAIDKYRDVEGLQINERFSQRLDLGSMSAYANFKAKDIQINSAIEDSIFNVNK